MWFLYAIQDYQETTRTLLRPGRMYTLGRKEADILPPIIEKSISRKHASLTIEPITAENWNDFDGKPSVHFRDLGSKYGSFINSTRVEGVSLEQGVYLKDGDTLKIGTKTALFRLSWQPLTICRQSMALADKQKLINGARQIGAKVTHSIRSPYTHLLLSSIQISFKVARCLAVGKPIVSQKWLDVLVDLPDSDYTFPPVTDYLPPLDASCQGPRGVPDFSPNQDRKRLFTEKRFVFFEEDQYRQLSPLIESCNGQSALLDVNKTDPFEEQLGNENVIIVNSAKLDESHGGKNIINAMDSLQKRCFASMDICWAILYCSMDVECNAQYGQSFTASASLNDPPTFNTLDAEPENTSTRSSPPPTSATRVPSNADILPSSSTTAVTPTTEATSTTEGSETIASSVIRSASSSKRKQLPEDHQTSDQASSRPAANPVVKKNLDLDDFFDQIVGDEPSRPAPTATENTSPAPSSDQQISEPSVNRDRSDDQNNTVSTSDDMAVDEQMADEQHDATNVTGDKGKERMHEPATLSDNDGIPSMDDDNETASTQRKSKKPRTGKTANSTAPPPAPRKPFILPELENENADITSGKSYTKVIYSTRVVASSPPENWTTQQQQQSASGEINYKKFKKTIHSTPSDPLLTVGMVAGTPPESEESEPMPAIDDNDFSDIRILPNTTRGKMRI